MRQLQGDGIIDLAGQSLEWALSPEDAKRIGELAKRVNGMPNVMALLTRYSDLVAREEGDPRPEAEVGEQSCRSCTDASNGQPEEDWTCSAIDSRLLRS